MRDKIARVSHVLTKTKRLIALKGNVANKRKWKHDRVEKVIHWEQCKKRKFKHTSKWYMHKPETTQQNETHKILLDFHCDNGQNEENLLYNWLYRPSEPQSGNKRKRKTKTSTHALPEHLESCEIWGWRRNRLLLTHLDWGLKELEIGGWFEPEYGEEFWRSKETCFPLRLKWVISLVDIFSAILKMNMGGT